MRAAVIQMNSGRDVAANLAAAQALLEAAAGDGAQLAVLPENFGYLSRRDADRNQVMEQPDDGPMQNFLAETAARLALYLVGGSVPVITDGDVRPWSRCAVYAPNGDVLGSYDKVHLFDVDLPSSDEHYRESQSTRPGESAVALPLGETNASLGLSICYDLRFPEMYRALSARGANILTVPSAFTVPTGKAHWELLLRARAVENLGYVLGAGQCGEHPGGRRTWGHSMIVSPWGEILAEAGSKPGYVVADLDLAALDIKRREFPVLDHRRL